MARVLAQLPDYDILGRLGRGAGAVIYEARRKSDRERVAVKHVVRKTPKDDRFIEQAETEYEVAHSLRHPILRTCFDIFRVRRWMKTRELFLVMEYVDGERLENQFEARRPDNLPLIVKLFAKVAQGLQAMHRTGYVHADIKPNNILLTSDGDVRVIDFGQSCKIGTTKARIQGTPDFIAPEQVRLEPLDQRTDVFNLGATMYWVLTGKAYSTILPGAQAAPGVKKIEADAIRGNDPPHEVNPKVPLPLSRLVQECCATERDQRPWDMSALLSRLETVMHVMTRAEGDPVAPRKQKDDGAPAPELDDDGFAWPAAPEPPDDDFFDQIQKDLAS